MTREAQFHRNQHPKTLLLGIHAPYNTTKDIDSYFQEFINLVKSNGVPYDYELFIKLREVDNGYFITKGKLEEIKTFCDENFVEEVIISEPLTGQQERNLRDLLRCEIFDRTQLILEIFEKNAHSAEGKIQVEIAMLEYKKTRLAGRGKYMSQQAGRIGSKGPGETQKEKDTRHIERAIFTLKRHLEKMHKARDTQRKQRLGSSLPLMCLIGYTNAGKSTLLNALTKSTVLAEDRLFATLDTTTRELYLDHKKVGLMSDTVGFIQLLPHHLIEAFKSTLSELQYADLLLHVVDISDPNWESHIAVVHNVLAELGINKEMVYVFNKADKVPLVHFMKGSLEVYDPHVVISSISKEGLDPLVEFIKDWTASRNIS